MSFVLVKKTVVKWPVKVRVPRDDGRVSEQSFTATFDILNSDATEDLSPAKFDVELLERALIGADGLVNEAKEPIAWDDDVKHLLISTPYIRLALVNAYNEAQLGKKGKS